MTEQTPYLDLTLYNSTTDATTKSFLEYRTSMAGIGGTSNLSKIDTAVGALQGNTVIVVDGVNYAKTQAGIQAAIDADTDNYTVYVPPGAYSITSSLSVSGKTNFHLIFDKGAVLTATAGVTFTMLGVTSSSDVLVEGGKFDANDVGVSCITVYNTGTTLVSRVEIRDTECLDSTSYALQVTHDGTNFFYTEDITLQGNYVHGAALDCINVKATTRARIIKNVVNDITASKAGIHHNGIDCLISGNVVTGYSGTGKGMGIGGFMSVNAVCTDNIIDGGSQTNNSTSAFGMYFDTPNSITISGNSVKGGGSGIRVEVGSSVTIDNNTLDSNGYNAIRLEGRNDIVQKNSFDSDPPVEMIASANITLSTDTSDKQEDTGSLQAVVAAGFSTGTLFYQDFGSLQDWSTLPYVYLWIKSDTIVNSGVLQLKLSATTGLASPHTTLNIPYLPANQWVRLILFSNRGFTVPTLSVRSWGIVASSDPGVITLHFDDLGAGTSSINSIISNNIINRPWNAGIVISSNGTATVIGDALKNCNINNNVIRDAGWGSNYTTGETCGIFINCTNNYNSINQIQISENRVSYIGNGTTSTDRGLFLRVSGTGAVLDEVRVLNNNFSKCSTPIALSGVPTNYVNIGNSIKVGMGKIYDGIPNVLFNRVNNTTSTTTGEETLHTYSIPGGLMTTAGQSLVAEYSGLFTGTSSTARTIKVTLAGTDILNLTGLVDASNTQWKIKVLFVMTTTTSGRAVVEFYRRTTLSVPTISTSIASLDLATNTTISLKATTPGAGDATSNYFAMGTFYPVSF